MKILIIEGTQVNYGNDQGGVHEDAGAIIDVPKDVAVKLTTNNRALYTVKSDDPFKDGRFTATAEQIKAAKDLAKAREASANSPDA